jgi:uncharacterized protein
MRLGSLYREDTCLVARTWLADTAFSRLCGLLGRATLASDAREGLLLKPCGSVHTFGMRYPIDVVYLDTEGRVLKMRENILPARVSACRGARQALELFAGGIEILRPQLGDQWVWRPM